MDYFSLLNTVILITLVNVSLFIFYRNLVGKMTINLSDHKYNKNLVLLEKLVLTEFNDHQTFIFNKINQQITEQRMFKREVDQSLEKIQVKLQENLQGIKGQLRLLNSSYQEIEKHLKLKKKTDNVYSLKN